MKNRIYIFINIVIISFASFLLYTMIFDSQFSLELKIINLSLIIILFLLVHFFKLLRLYLIFLEEKIPWKRFIKIYIKTMFINIAIPYKLGEFFRIYSYGHELKDYKKGFLGIVLERFFDTLVLLLFLIPVQLLNKSATYNITIILGVVCIVLYIFYAIFQSSYLYLNKYLVIYPPTKKSVYALSVLESFNKWFLYVKNLIKGRVSLLLFFTSLSWLIEYYLLTFLANLMKVRFVFEDFVIYLNSAFYSINKNNLLINYIIIGVTTLFVLTISIYGIQYIKKEMRSKNEKNSYSL